MGSTFDGTAGGDGGADDAGEDQDERAGDVSNRVSGFDFNDDERGQDANQCGGAGDADHKPQQ